MQTIDGELVSRTEDAEPARRPSTTPRGALALVALATVTMAVLGWFDLGERSLWYDEAFTVGIVDRPLGDALWRIANWDLNQAPYYLLFLGWHAIDTSETFLRSLTVIFAVASVPALFVLARRMLDVWVAAVAALLLSTHAFFVEWSQQLRGYTLLVLLVIVATHLLLRTLDEPTTGRTIAYALVAAAAAYAHFFALLVIGAHALWLAVAVRPFPRRAAATASTVGGVLLVPLAWYLLTRQGDPLAWVARPSGPLLQETVTDLVGGSRALVALYGLAVLGGVVTLVRRRQRRADLLPVLWLVVPVAVTVVSSYVAKPLLVSRFLLVIVPALVIVAAVGIRALPRRGIQVVAVVAVMVASGAEVVGWYRASSFEDWRAATAAVLAEADHGDIVTVVPSRAVHAVRYYDERLPGPTLDPGQPDVSQPPASDQLWEIERIPPPGATADPVAPEYVDWRDEHFRLVDEEELTNVSVRRYVSR